MMAYTLLWTEFQAARPVDSPHVCSGHFKDVQFERLLEKDEVVVGHGKTVVVAGCEHRPAGDRGDDLYILQSRGILALVCRVEYQHFFFSRNN